MSPFQKISLSISRLGQFWQESTGSSIFRWNILFILVQLLALFIKYGDLPPEIPLYYSLPWGEAQLASVTSIFFLPLFSLIVLIINSCLAVFYFKSIRLLFKLLSIFSLIFSALSAVTLFQILNLIS
jgi:hypothetical protein